MHFQLDQYKDAVSSFFRILVPPLLNLFFVGLMFAPYLTVLSAGSKNGDDVDVPSVGERIEQFFSRIAATLDEVLASIARQLSTTTIDQANSVGGIALNVVLGTLIVLIVFILVIDLLIRTVGWLIPVRLTLDDKMLLKHRKFEEIMEVVKATFSDAETINKQDFNRYYFWLAVRNKLDENEKLASYRETRQSLMAKIALNERAFSYFVPYVLLACAAVYVAGFEPSVIFSFCAVLVSGLVLAWRQFSLTLGVILNDLETFVALDTWEFAKGPPALHEKGDPTPCWLVTFELVTKAHSLISPQDAGEPSVWRKRLHWLLGTAAPDDLNENKSSSKAD